jgi:ABC-2 type transport system permease protein
MRSAFELAKLELKLFFREPITMIFTFGLPLIFLPVMGSVFGNAPNPHIYRGVGAMNYYTPAYISLVLASIGLIQLPVHLANYKERGFTTVQSFLCIRRRDLWLSDDCQPGRGRGRSYWCDDNRFFILQRPGPA